ncbi:conserved hypothetical protein [Chloroherpeton thalassium ATCC 35110]|uniref:JAB domain-containing protein n=1 Tax=Chloroherpeton thalassium (strain ATCC 35110 / GB-78) TaxID=517418 RepID=B3QSD0_CHLT3|nr:M67 family metallopeptidase [Chloroherpeton thalassium]ACF12521.1 conserved hypothetical protein [Chloroherpeton thalassium ATCC 35110]
MQIPARKLEIVKEHAIQSFPEECCGLLAGKVELSHDGFYENVIYEVAPCRNVLTWDRQFGFEISWPEICEVESEARSMGYEILGSYHSHTNAEAVPSNHDYENSTPNHSMLILSVKGNLVLQTRCWTRQNGNYFHEERIHVRRW